MQKCVIYTRVSTDEQTFGYSLETQEAACKKYSEQQNLEVVKVFREEGVSAKTITNRPVLRELLSFCLDKKNSISTILVYKIDRWSRNVAEGTTALALLAKRGIDLKSVTEPSDNNPVGKAMRGILLVFAELDNNIRSERTTVGLKAAFESGRCPWKAKIGYRHTIIDGKKTIEMINAYKPIIFNLFTNAARGLYGKQHLADKMNQDGYSQLWGSAATTKTVDKILKSKFYYGILESKKWGEQQGIHEPIVTAELWLRANEAVYKLGKKWKNPTTITDFVLKGFIRCGNCKTLLRGSFSRGHGGRYGYYHCNNHFCKEPTRIRREKAEEKFKAFLCQFRLTQVQQKLLETVLIGKLESVAKQQESEMKKIDFKLHKISQAKQNIVNSVSNGLINHSEGEEMIDKLRSEETILKLERGEFNLDTEESKAVINFTYKFLSDISSFWERLEPIKKSRLQTLIFPNGVFFKNQECGTSTISPSFELIRSFTESTEPKVTPRGIEPRLAG